MSLTKIAKKVYVATNQSLGLEIREALLKDILSEFPSGYFDDKLYDTSEDGKGYRPGYVSFALKPIAWHSKSLIGGILVRGTYSSNVIKSDSPEPGTNEYKAWENAGGNKKLFGGEIEEIILEVGYYNKKASGSFQRGQSAGVYEIEIDKLEKIVDHKLADPSKTYSSIDKLVSDVLSNPPELAMGSGYITKNSPYTSFKKFVTHIRDEKRKNVTEKEVRLLADSIGKNYFDLVEKLRQNYITVQ